MRKDYAPGGANLSLAIDSNLLDTNPLFQVWKTKSFTDNDIVLHFFILNILEDGSALTAEEITDTLLSKYDALFDIQTVRRKCNTYAKEGLLQKQKIGKTVVFSLDNTLTYWLRSDENILDALAFYQMAGNFGIIGCLNISTLRIIRFAKSTVFLSTRWKTEYFLNCLRLWINSLGYILR